ncbi:MAG: LLM class F420-dependent oxidoreductase [Actinomycetota bacterium]
MTKFGLQLPDFNFEGPDSEVFEKIVGLTTAAESSGFDSLWVMDHLFQLPPLGGPDARMFEAYTLLGALAARTSKIRLGALVTGVTYRNPGMLAKIVTTLDVISKGRAILGIGAAWYDVEHKGLGFDFPSDKERLERLEEAVQICKLMFTQDRASFTGKHYRVDDARNVPRPIQPGGPKIMIGGGGEKKTLRLVAKYADMANVFGDPAGIRHKVQVLRQHCESVGRDPSEITFSRLASLFLIEDPAAAKTFRDGLAQQLGEEQVSAFHIGGETEIVDQIEAVIQAGAQYLIFNLPGASPDQVSRVGDILITHFT